VRNVGILRRNFQCEVPGTLLYTGCLSVCTDFVAQKGENHIMKEFMLFIRNDIDHQANRSTEQHHQFLKKCEEYIGSLKKEGKLKSAQPLVREGKMISGGKGRWQDGAFNESREVFP